MEKTRRPLINMCFPWIGSRLYKGDTENLESRGELSVSIRIDGSKEKISGYICFGEICG
jgi:hypothetical protein